MLYMLAVLFVILWGLGLLANVTAGGLIHALLVLAIVAVLLRILAGRKAV